MSFIGMVLLCATSIRFEGGPYAPSTTQAGLFSQLIAQGRMRPAYLLPTTREHFDSLHVSRGYLLHCFHHRQITRPNLAHSSSSSLSHIHQPTQRRLIVLLATPATNSQSLTMAMTQSTTVEPLDCSSKQIVSTVILCTNKLRNPTLR